jgi:hypothetical protein
MWSKINSLEVSKTASAFYLGYATVRVQILCLTTNVSAENKTLCRGQG